MNKCIISLQIRLFNIKSKIDYIAFFVFGIAPIVASFIIGTGFSIAWERDEKIIFKGYLYSYNWTMYIILLPLSLLLFRIITERLYGISNNNKPKMIRIFFKDDKYRLSIKKEIELIALDKINFYIAFFSTVLFNFLDMRETLAYYYFEIIGKPLTNPPREPSWGHFFWIENQTQVSLGENLLFYILAHINQFILVFLIFLGNILVFRYNLYYLRLIYQRYRAINRPEHLFIALNFDDENRCFGLKKLNEVFNIQVAILIVCGVFVLVSRWANVEENLIEKIYLVIFDSHNQTLVFDFFFPDIGQIVMAFTWILALFVVMMPAFVKFLPLLNGEREIRSYLLQFIKPTDERYINADHDDQILMDLAEKFGKNYFWPAGDRLAKWLFRFAFFVFFSILFPLQPSDGYIGFFFLYIIVLLVLSFLIVEFLFYVFRELLKAFVDEQLVEVSWVRPVKPTWIYSRLHRQAYRQDSPKTRGRKDGQALKVFVSYAHEDDEYLGDNSLLGFLSGLEKEGVEFWTDRRIRAGECWDDVIKENIRNAQIALVLVSQAFLDSDYCQNVEIRSFLAQKVDLIPIILSPCEWQRHEWLSQRQFLPGDDETIETHYSERGQRKALFLKIRQALRERVEPIRR